MRNKNKNVFNYKLNIFLFYIILNFLSSIFCSNYISMKIINYSNEQINKISDNSFSVEDFMNTKINNQIYTKLNIGEPSQEIITWINTEEYSYFIFKDTCLIDSDFNEKKSSTFEPNYDNTFYYNGYGKTIFINETIILNNDINNDEKNIKIKKFPIMFMKDPKNDEFFMKRFSLNDITGKTCATIGLRHSTNFQDTISKNFLLVLKDKDIIDDYILFFDYDKNGDEKFLLFGGYPEEIYNKKKFKPENQKITHIKLYNRFKPQWGFKCDKIISGNTKINKEEIALHHNLGVIYGPKEYQDHIESKFFNQYFYSKICNKKVNEQYTIFYCNKEKFTLEEKKKFPILQFLKTELEENFNLTYEDLFYNKGNNEYFLIVFNHLYDEIWELGKPFLNKFTFSFNFDSKLIWYYKNLGDDEENSELNNNLENINDKSKFIYIILILSVVLGILCFLFGRKYYNKRKSGIIKAKELEQNFSYHEPINKNEIGTTRLMEE